MGILFSFQKEGMGTKSVGAGTSGRCATALASLLGLVLVSAARAILVVEAVVLNVLDDGLWDEVANAHVALAEKSNLCAGNVILDQLLHDVNVVLPLLEGGESLINVGSSSLRKSSVSSPPGYTCAGLGGFRRHTSMMNAPKLLKM